ncbi:hypothetical protein C9374_011242 [Naegleria lovaniensis]|uniref:Phosphodiesterase n=1 Tax=Naegleria lovaniensis TaxID=51637 RepID=A0AA88H3S0_NAELO|nr:uncharacterized protein C9374_011242 [Naegleria lovaniensis]KAG2392517.1 hypothetical protein C9374_011242 [Naegleria lovaniensis]
MGSGSSTAYAHDREPPLFPLYQVPKGNSNPIVAQLGAFQKTFCEMYDKEGGGKNYEKLKPSSTQNNTTLLASRKLWVGCSPSPDLENLIIAVTDLREKYFEKVLTQKSLNDMKNSLSKELKLANMEWKVFFDTLRASITQSGRLRVTVDEAGNQCKVLLEMTANKQKADIALKLARIGEPKEGKSPDYWTQLYHSFIYPLYSFYLLRTETTPTERIDQLERDLKVMKEKYQYFLQIREKLAKKSGEPNIPVNASMEERNAKALLRRQNSEMERKRKEIESLVFPAQQISKFLINIKKKLIKNKAITEKEYENFNVVINSLRFDSIHKIEFGKNLREYDQEVVQYIKTKFVDAAHLGGKSKPVEDKKAEPAKEPVKTVAEPTTQVAGRPGKEELNSVLEKLDKWNYDVFKITELSNNHPLFFTSYALFLKYDLLNKFNINEKVLISFLREIEAGYQPNPYHNNMHATDVLQCTHYIISKGGLSQYMTDEDIFASLMAAICHDYQHPGLNNNFQMNSHSYLSILYNDRSVLENHHVAETFELMRSKEFDVFQTLSDEQYKDIRETMIQMILATDMALHATILGRFKSRIETENESSEIDFSAKEDVRLALQIAIKIADVSNPARPLKLYLKWAKRIEEEFYKQGDKEKELGLALSPFMDRTKPSLNNLQSAFINYIVSPMMKSYCRLLPKMNFAMEHIATNLEYWKENKTINIEDLQD